MADNICLPPLRRYKPAGDPKPSVFLAGSIEMGKATDWQARATNHLSHYTSIIYNPRRKDWDSSWPQDITSPDFNNQVNWELDMIALSDIVLVHFEGGTYSPITLLELGLVVGTKDPDSIIVSCHADFYRRGNVLILCERHGIKVYDDLDDALKSIRLIGSRLGNIT